MDACKPNTEKSHAISRASSSASVDSRAASEGGVERTTTRRKIEASTLSKRKREIPISCSGQVGGSSSSAAATSITTPPERFLTFKLPDDLPTDEEIRQRATCRRMELCLMMKRNAELLSRLNLQMMNDVKIELQRRGQQNSEAYRRAEIMITKLEELVIAAKALPLPSFDIATSNSADKETPGEGPPMNEVKTVAKYNTRKLKIGKQVTETSIVVAKKNPSSRR